MSAVTTGIVIETNVRSVLGNYVYSDLELDANANTYAHNPYGNFTEVDNLLNALCRTVIIGPLAAALKVAFLALNLIFHLGLALITRKKGHLAHVVKSGCEIIRGAIEMIPLIGRIFTILYTGLPFIFGGYGQRISFWMIKVMTPETITNAHWHMPRYKLN